MINRTSSATHETMFHTLNSPSHSNARESIGFSMAVTLIVILTAIFFIALFSICVRRFTSVEVPSRLHRTSRQPPSYDRNRGLDISTVNSLPLVAYTKSMIGDCPICLSEFQERETVRFIPYCSHVFHPRCIDTWLNSHVTCPLCRSAQLFKRGEDVCLV